MEQIMRVVLLIAGAMIILWILYDGLRRQRKAKKALQKIDEESVSEDVLMEANAFVEQDDFVEDSTRNQEIVDDVIMMMIAPLSEKTFAGNFLLQTLFSHDLHYGDNHIFHYYSTASNNLEKPLFSIASASKSGDFDLENMRENSYYGLVVFMNRVLHLYPAEVFDKMVSVAGNLAASLDAKLLTSDQQPWSDEIAAQIRARL